MSQDDPPRLRTREDAPPELSRALHALRDEAGDRARIERVAQKLGPVLDAAPGTGTMLRRWPVFLREIAAWKLWLTGAALGAGLVWLSWPMAQGPSATPHVAAPLDDQAAATRASPSTAEAQPPAASPRTASAPTSAAAPPASAAAQGGGALGHERPSAAATRSGSLASQRPRPSKVGGPSGEKQPSKASGRKEPTTANPASNPASRTRARAEQAAPQALPASKASEAQGAVSQAEAERSSEPATVAEHPTASPPRSELDLLFEARAVMAAAPAQALRLLNEHAARFQDGMLAPEREVMAIEILRRLGKNAEAQKRLERFRARYPASLHLPRLEQNTP